MPCFTARGGLAARIALLLLALCGACASGRPSVRLDDVVLEELDGRSAPLAALRGRPLLLYLLTTSCDTCMADFDKLRALHQTYAGRGLRVVVVALDPAGARLVRPYAQTLQLPFPVVVAPAALRQGESGLGLTPQVPRVVVADGQLRPCLDSPGVVAYGALRDAVERAFDAGGCGS